MTNDELNQKAINEIKKYKNISKIFLEKIQELFLHQINSWCENPLILLLLQNKTENLKMLEEMLSDFPYTEDSYSNDLNPHDKNFNKKIHNFHSEVITYKYLKNKGYTNIEKLSSTDASIKTPDFKATYKNDRYVIEVKTLRTQYILIDRILDKLDFYRLLNPQIFKKQMNITLDNIERLEFKGRNFEDDLEKCAEIFVDELVKVLKSDNVSPTELVIKTTFHSRIINFRVTLNTEQSLSTIRYSTGNIIEDSKIKEFLDKSSKAIPLLKKVFNVASTAQSQLNEFVEKNNEFRQKLIVLRWIQPEDFYFDKDIKDFLDANITFLNNIYKASNLEFILL